MRWNSIFRKSSLQNLHDNYEMKTDKQTVIHRGSIFLIIKYCVCVKMVYILKRVHLMSLWLLLFYNKIF